MSRRSLTPSVGQCRTNRSSLVLYMLLQHSFRKEGCMHWAKRALASPSWQKSRCCAAHAYVAVLGRPLTRLSLLEHALAAGELPRSCRVARWPKGAPLRPGPGHPERAARPPARRRRLPRLRGRHSAWPSRWPLWQPPRSPSLGLRWARPPPLQAQGTRQRCSRVTDPPDSTLLCRASSAAPGGSCRGPPQLARLRCWWSWASAARWSPTQLQRRGRWRPAGWWARCC